MKRTALHDFGLILAVVVLAATMVDVILPAPVCTHSRLDPEAVSVSVEAGNRCARMPTTVDKYSREP
ncbi:MAG: hypothetical protein ABIP44_14025 [Pseudoxanthomonas sp.]